MRLERLPVTDSCSRCSCTVILPYYWEKRSLSAEFRAPHNCPLVARPSDESLSSLPFVSPNSHVGSPHFGSRMSTDLDGGGEGGGSGYNMAEPTPVQTFYPASPSGWHYQPHPSSRAYRAPPTPNSQHQPELRSYGATPPSPALTSSSSVLSPLIQGPSFAQHLSPAGLASQNISSHPNLNSLGQHQQNSSQPYLFSFPALDSHAGPTRRLTIGSQDREESLAHEGGNSFAPPGKIRMARSFSTGDSRYISEMREMTEAEIKEEKRKRVRVMPSTIRILMLTFRILLSRTFSARMPNPQLGIERRPDKN